MIQFSRADKTYVVIVLAKTTYTVDHLLTYFLFFRTICFYACKFYNQIEKIQKYCQNYVDKILQHSYVINIVYSIYYYRQVLPVEWIPPHEV